MKLSRQQPQEPAKAAEAPAVALTVQKAAHALPEGFKAQAQAPLVEGLRAFASGATAVKEYEAPIVDLCADTSSENAYHKARSSSWEMLGKQVFPGFDEWFQKVGGLKGLSGEWGNTWEDLYSEWADEEFSGLKAGPRKQALMKQFKEEKAEDAIRELYGERTRLLESLEFPLAVYRSVDLPGEAALRTDKVGIFWTHVEEKATSYWGTEGHTPYILKGVVDVASVDWIETLMRHMDPCGAGEEEEEIRLTEGALVKIDGIRHVDSPEWTPMTTNAKA